MLADALFTGPLSGYRDLRCGTLEAAPKIWVAAYHHHEICSRFAFGSLMRRSSISVKI